MSLYGHESHCELWTLTVEAGFHFNLSTLRCVAFTWIYRFSVFYLLSGIYIQCNIEASLPGCSLKPHLLIDFININSTWIPHIWRLVRQVKILFCLSFCFLVSENLFSSFYICWLLTYQCHVKHFHMLLPCHKSYQSKIFENWNVYFVNLNIKFKLQMYKIKPDIKLIVYPKKEESIINQLIWEEKYSKHLEQMCYFDLWFGVPAE